MSLSATGSSKTLRLVFRFGDSQTLRNLRYKPTSLFAQSGREQHLHQLLWIEAHQQLLTRPPLQTVQSIVSRINSTQVVRAAIYDLLFSMCDRHLGNIFVDEYSNIKLIDNDQVCPPFSNLL